MPGTRALGPMLVSNRNVVFRRRVEAEIPVPGPHDSDERPGASNDVVASLLRLGVETFPVHGMYRRAIDSNTKSSPGPSAIATSRPGRGPSSRSGAVPDSKIRSSSRRARRRSCRNIASACHSAVAFAARCIGGTAEGDVIQPTHPNLEHAQTRSHRNEVIDRSKAVKTTFTDWLDGCRELVALLVEVPWALRVDIGYKAVLGQYVFGFERPVRNRLEVTARPRESIRHDWRGEQSFSR